MSLHRSLDSMNPGTSLLKHTRGLMALFAASITLVVIIGQIRGPPLSFVELVHRERTALLARNEEANVSDCELRLLVSRAVEANTIINRARTMAGREDLA